MTAWKDLEWKDMSLSQRAFWVGFTVFSWVVLLAVVFVVVGLLLGLLWWALS